MRVTGPVEEDALLWNACLTDVQWRQLLAWAATQDDNVYESISRAHEYAKATVVTSGR